MEELPFDEIIKDGYHYRTFHESTEDGDFMWHRDREDRIVESVGETNWLIQLDNEVPKSLNEKTFIPMGVYHRIIKGTGDVTVRVKKLV